MAATDCIGRGLPDREWQAGYKNGARKSSTAHDNNIKNMKKGDSNEQ
jgi:hypothetical protein